jgi:basic amino acid/polyamine antiporter, APA family
MSFGFKLKISILLLIVTLLIMGYLWILPQPNKPEGTFECPLMPLVPCLGILGNFTLIAQNDANTWIYFIIFEIIGFVFYFSYGIKHSKLNRLIKKLEEQ